MAQKLTHRTSSRLNRRIVLTNSLLGLLPLSVGCYLATAGQPVLPAKALLPLTILIQIGLTFVGSAAIQSSLRTMIRHIEQSISNLNQAVQSGTVAYRLAPVDNEYRAITEQLNGLMTAFQAPLQQIADDVGRMALGEMPSTSTSHYQGQFKIISNHINACAAAISLMLEDANNLAMAAVTGDLATRADDTRHQGDFRRIIEGTNITLDAVFVPFLTATDAIKQLAYGIIPPSITTDYYGNYNDLKNHINSLIDSQANLTQAATHISHGQTDLQITPRSEHDQLSQAMQRMSQTIQQVINDVNTMATAAQSGQLDIRVDSTPYKGDFKVVIDGLNGVMNAIAMPLDEAAQVLQSAAQCDLTTRLSGTYQGKLETFKNDLNNTLEALEQALTDVRDTVSVLSEMTKTISDTSQSLSSSADRQASSIVEISASMSQVKGLTRINAENANQATALSKNTRDLAASGQETMDQMREAMQDISESSTQISRIIKVIEEIAFQTNLLALNAAVEAARAGRHGKGFAVVADEVRNLAGRSAKAAKETTGLIESSKNKVQTGSQLTRNTADLFNDIVQGINTVSTNIEDIADSSKEQAQGVQQATLELSQVDSITQKNTADANQTAQIARKLDDKTEQLKKLIDSFKISNN